MVSIPDNIAALCDRIAAGRNARAIKKGRKEVYGVSPGDSRLRVDIVGMRGEGGFALAMQIGNWNPGPSLDYSGDVGEVGIRTTDSQNGRLIIYDSDVNDKPYALVILRQEQIAEIIGWQWLGLGVTLREHFQCSQLFKENLIWTANL